MKDFDTCLNAFNVEFNDFLENYKFLDKDSSFTPELLNEINKIIAELNECSSLEITTLEKRKEKLNNSFKSFLKEYYKTERISKNELKSKLKAIKDDADSKILELKKDLQENKSKFEKNEYDTLNDINFYIEASNQNIDMFEIECRDNLNRFAYQIDVAKSSYNNNIDTFNSQLEAQLEKVTSIYKENIEKCDKSYNDLVESYNLIIQEKNKLIENKKQEYHIAQVELKNKKRQESTDLNDLIRKYSEEKSIQISKYRNEYLDAQKSDNDAKIYLMNGYKDENFKANKEFVQNINDLDSKIKDLRDQFEKYCDNENQTKYYKIFDIHTEQEKLIREYIQDNKNNAKLKADLKRINKEFYNRVNEENKKCEKILAAAKKNYSRENSQGLYEKKILDISRTTFFAKLNEKQIRDNKYYQERSNIYETQFNYNSLIATNEYNRNANKVLLDSSIRNLEIEKEIDETDAKYQIQIETLSDVIKKYQLEISIAKKLNELNHLFLDEKYNREISFLTVSNLLKIEKCKVLDQYNIRQYELNIENSNNILEYSKKKINLQNEKYSALKKQDIVISHSELQNIISKNSYDVFCINSKCLYEQDIANKEMKHNTALNKSNLLNEKFIVELDEYENILQAFVLIYSNAIKAWTDIIDLLFSLNTDEKLVERFLNDLLSVFKLFINDLSDTYKTMINEEITSHINFDNEFKYKDSIDILNERQDSELSVVNHKKDLLIKESELLKGKNDDIRLRLFTIQYDDGAKYNRSTRRELIKKLINELRQNNKQLNALDDKINEVVKDAKAVEKKYEKQINSVLEEQEIDSTPYQAFNKQVDEIINKLKENINSQINIEELSLKERFRVLLVNLNSSYLTDLFLNNSNFSEKYQYSYNLAIEKINSEYDYDIKTTIEAFEKQMEQAKEKFIHTNNDELRNIKDLIDERNKIENNYNNTIKNNDLIHQQEINQILLAKKNSTNQFYNELYAVDDNLNDIEADYYFNLKNQESNYEKNKQKIVDETIQIKNDYNRALSNYISNRRAIINHLPIAIKENEKELIADFKEKNKELDLKMIQSKKEFGIKKALQKKNLNVIELNYKASIVKIEANDRSQKNKEKKNLASELVSAN